MVIGYVILVLLILPAEEVFIVCYRVHQYEPYDFYIAIAEQMRDMISNAFATSNVHTGTIAGTHGSPLLELFECNHTVAS